MKQALLGLLASAGVLLVSGASAAAPAAASTGASIDLGRVAVTEDLLPGNEYRLPTIGVRNPGTELSLYRLIVSHEADETRRQAPGAWFTFQPAMLTLEGGASRAVDVRLEIPADAEPGEYAALIGPRLVTDAPGATVGVGAAARVSFTVVPSSLLDAWLRRLGRLATEAGLLTWLSVACVILLLFVRLVRRRYHITISRRYL